MRLRSATGIVALAVAVAACTPAGSSPEPQEPESSTSSTVIEPLFPETPTTTAPTTTTTTTMPFDGTATASRARMEQDLLTLLDIGARPSGTPAEWAAGTWLLDALVTITGEPLRANANETRFRLPGDRLSRNITGVLRRPVPADGDAVRVVVAAQYDSVAGSAGIDSNGSGVAALLEIARRFASDPAPGLEVGISFLGSRDDEVRGSEVEADRLRLEVDLVVVLDEVGSAVRPEAQFALGNATADALDRLQRAAQRVGTSVATVMDQTGVHAAFAARGVPGFTLTRPGNPRAGLPSDTVADLDGMVEVVEMIESFLRNLASAADN